MKPLRESKIPDMYMLNFSKKLTGHLATKNEVQGNLYKNIDLFYIRIMNKHYKGLQLLTVSTISVLIPYIKRL